MAKVKTWVWIVAGVIGLGILGIVAMAAAGLWFVRSHVDVRSTTVTAASRRNTARTGGGARARQRLSRRRRCFALAQLA